MDPDVDVARQLVYAFSDAVERCDADGREYAGQQLAEFIDEADDGTADAVLVALLDVPLDTDTLPLLNEVSAKLGRRGPGVVETLLAAALGEAPPELSPRDIVSVAGAVGALLELATRSPGVPPRTENAVSVLRAMPQGDLILGLIEVLEGPADRRLKRAASEALVEIGEPAVERLQMSLRDRDAEPWVIDTLVDIRDGCDQGGSRDDDVSDEASGRAGDEASGRAGDQASGYASDDRTGGGEADHATDVPADDEPDDAPRAAPADATARGAPPAGAPPGVPAPPPDADDIDRDYDSFLARFKRETGQR